MRKNRQNQSSTEIAGRNYQAEDYTRKDELSQALAMTHEQASDSLTEGTIDGKIDKVDEKNIDLKR